MSTTGVFAESGYRQWQPLPLPELTITHFLLRVSAERALAGTWG
jgi:hypothetical protein